jgi:hypothetical protein
MRHYAASRKVAGSNLNGGHGLNPSGRTMSLGSTQPLTDMSTIVSPGQQRRPVRRANNVDTFMCGFSENSESLNFLEL